MRLRHLSNELACRIRHRAGRLCLSMLAIAALGQVATPASAAAAKMTLSTGTTSTVAPSPATSTASAKLASDLLSALTASSTPKLTWAKDVNGQRHVKVIVVGTPSADPELSALRDAALAAGGSVYFRYTSVAALSAMLPASQVLAIASRSDVQSLSPNRMTARTATTVTPSHLEQATGATGVRTRDAGSALGYTGLDGSGVGIAVLDSGVLFKHNLLTDAAGATRVRFSVDMLLAGDTLSGGAKDWTPGVDRSAALYPGSPTMSSFLRNIDSSRAKWSDAYGHGTHVAAAGITVVVAAGNFGKDAGGAERYGTISSPGHDPSVITVGSANTKGTDGRGDDVVNGFSSRGPTRGATVGADGVRRIDNLLKPDLVAPGNRIVSAMSVANQSMNS